MPAEWHPHAAVWLAWPSHPEEWDRYLEPARQSVADMCRALAGPPGVTSGVASGPGDRPPRTERIEMLVLDDAGEASARSALGALEARYHRIPFGDIWLRDTGPVFLHRDSMPGAACFAWNGWGGKYLFEHDAEVGGRIAEVAGPPGRAVERHPFVLEGGAIDCDGQGTVLTTRQCLLNENRNSGPDEATMTARLQEALGARRVLWLDRGLAGDHTDGHIDNLARFVAPGVVLCMGASEPADPNRQALESASRELRRFRDANGRPLEVIEIPSPGRVEGHDGAVAPASYMNFYIGNRAVVVPTYDKPGDKEAVATLARLFPERRVIGLDGRALLTGGGAFHCITRDQPQPRSLP